MCDCCFTGKKQEDVKENTPGKLEGYENSRPNLLDNKNPQIKQ